MEINVLIGPNQVDERYFKSVNNYDIINDVGIYLINVNYY